MHARREEIALLNNERRIFNFSEVNRVKEQLKREGKFRMMKVKLDVCLDCQVAQRLSRKMISNIINLKTQ